MKKIFDDIRPYYDSEIPEAMKRIADSPMLSLVASYVYPNKQLRKCCVALKPPATFSMV